MLKLCLGIAASIAAAHAAMAGFRQDQAVPPEYPPLQRCVIERLKVDGLAVVEHQWCAWTGRRWVPLMSDDGQHTVFGITPVITLPGPPIPKHQRRME